MRLSAAESLDRLVAGDHGVLATLHRERGVDAVPVVYVVVDRHLAVPIDRVKPKAPGRLQRERNLASDPRATLLIDHWDADDWSRLWWVRAELIFTPEPSTETEVRLGERLRSGFAQYADAPFERLLVFSITNTSGWSATG